MGSAGTRDPEEDDECEGVRLGEAGQAVDGNEETDTLRLTNGAPYRPGSCGAVLPGGRSAASATLVTTQSQPISKESLLPHASFSQAQEKVSK